MNKPSKRFLAALLAAVALGAAGSALAHGGRVNFGLGLHFGPYWGPFWGPAWYPAPVYVPPPVIISAPPAPTHYVERADQPLSPGYWYYCESARGYYPYVKECAGGWRAVPPAPPPAQ